MFHVGWSLFFSVKSGSSRAGARLGAGWTCSLSPCRHNERVEIPPPLLLLSQSHNSTWALNNNTSSSRQTAGVVVAPMLLLHCCCLGSGICVRMEWSWQPEAANSSTVFHCLWFICFMRWCSQWLWDDKNRHLENVGRCCRLNLNCPRIKYHNQASTQK